jgi:lipoate-protein ligase B
MSRELAIEWLGLVSYREALELQHKCVEARRAGAASDKLLLLEHPPTSRSAAARARIRCS